MSEPTASTAAPPAKPAGKKILGLNRTTVIVFAVTLVVVGGWFLYKRRQASTAAASTAATGTSTTGTGTDNAGDLAAIQSELEQLLASQGAAGGQGAGSSGGGGTTTTTPVTEPVSPAVPAATPTTSTGGTGTATAAKTAGAISNLNATATGKTTARVTWNPAANAAGGYAYQVKQLNGKLVASGTTHATSVNLSGLHAGWEYNFGIQALPGGPGDNIHFTTKS